MLESHTFRSGTASRRTTRHDPLLRRGAFALGDVLRVSADDVATLCGAALPASFEGAVFLDTETTGLGGGAGTHVFLLGAASFEGGALEVRQWVLPDPAAEEPFLDALEWEAARARSVVTFHGRGFDLPRLEERCLLAGRRFPFADTPHVDLLLGARRVLRMRTGRVGLQHLEREVLGVHRQDDLPGSECPAAWFAYVKGDPAPMERVLEHNLLDLLTLPALAAALAAAARGEAPAPDLHLAGRVFARSGLEDRALGLQREAARTADAGSLAALAHHEAARLLRRRGLTAEAAAAALAATLADPGLPGPWTDLAKHAEHVSRDLPFALECARRAERCIFLRSRSVAARREAAKRIARIAAALGGVAVGVSVGVAVSVAVGVSVGEIPGSPALGPSGEPAPDPPR